LKITDWIISIATVVLVIITAIYVVLTYSLLEETRKQAVLTQDPVIRILPEEDVHGDRARFDLEVSNTGIGDVSDLKIYEDYFIVFKSEERGIIFHKIGFMMVKPNEHILSLKRGEKQAFKLEFSEDHERMVELWEDESMKGGRMMIVRLKITYRRAEDGKKFVTSKIYGIDLSGTFLIDYDERGLPPFPSGNISLSEIKQALGIE
jgi:hypothetical protein